MTKRKGAGEPEPPLRFFEAFFLYPWTGPTALAKLTGMTFEEVVEAVDKLGIPRPLVFQREISERYGLVWEPAKRDRADESWSKGPEMK